MRFVFEYYYPLTLVLNLQKCVAPYTGWYGIFLSYLGHLYEPAGLVKAGFTWRMLIIQYLSKFDYYLPKTLLGARNLRLHM